MACNKCETQFESYQGVVVSIVKSGSKALLYVKNQGKNIVLIRRILLCYTTKTGSGTLYLRAAPDAISWTYPSTYLETGITALYYSLDVSGMKLVQAQAEYVEITGRSRSCAATF